MQFRKGTSILLALFILFSNLGLAFNVHYCQNKIASVSVNYEFSETCDAPITSCCAAENNHKKCCSDKVVKLEKKSDNILVKSLQLDLHSFIVGELNWGPNFNSVASVDSNQMIDFYCDSNAPPFYKLYCQLVFYA